MPKWSDRKSQAPVGGLPPKKGPRPKREKPPVADITPEKDARTPEQPGPKHPETLQIDTSPAPDGIRYEILNIGGVSEYLVVLTNGDAVYGHKATRHSGLVPVPDLTLRRGEWTGLLIIDNADVVDTVEFEMDLTVQWLAETLGEVDIRFGPSDGMIDRLGSTRIRLWPRGTMDVDSRELSPTIEDIVLCVLFPDLPEEMPDPRPEFTLQIDRPRGGGLYYRTQAPVARVAGYRFKVLNNLPCMEPGDWFVTVMLGEQVLGREVLKIARWNEDRDGRPPVSLAPHEERVEEMAVNIVS